MKTNTRVRRNGSANGATRQVRNKHEAAPAKNGNRPSPADDPAGSTEPPAAGREPCVLIFMKDGIGHGGLDYSAEEMARIECVAKYRGQTVSGFLRAAMDASLNNLDLIQKLEDGINMSYALYDLMEHRVFHPADGDPTEDWECGVVGLASAAFGKLQQARDAMDCALVAKGGE